MNTVTLRRLSAGEQMAVEREHLLLLPMLLERGLGQDDAAALAYNTTLLYHAAALDSKPDGPAGLLELLSLGQIAALCEEYERGRPALEALRVRCGKGKSRELSA